MSKYARIHTSVQVAAGSDYRGGRMVGFEQTETPDEYMVGMVVDATVYTGGGSTVDLGNYTTVTAVILHNESTTTDAWVDFRSEINSVSGLFTIANANPDTITADSGSPFTGWPGGCRITTTGDAELSSSLVQSTTGSVLTMGNSVELSGEVGSAVSLTITYEVVSNLHIPAGATVQIHSPVATNDLILYTASGTAAINVTILGTS